MTSGFGLPPLPSIRSLSPDLQRALLASAKRVTLEKNESLFRQGEQPKALYYLDRGLVRLSVTASNGKEAALAVLESGQWFGEASLFTETPHDYNAYALVSSELASVPTADFQRIVNQQPAFILEFTRLICSRYKWALQWIDSAILLPFPVRLAQRLLSAHQLLPETTSDDTNMLRISQEDLGHMLGISRQSINKQLKKWEADNILKLSYGRITILDLQALERIIRDAE
jgi:CRP/FNR family transcriptional regulator, cyclic AMP receptor protein